MSLVTASSFGLSFCLCLFMGLLTLRCAAEPPLKGDAISLDSRKNIALEFPTGSTEAPHVSLEEVFTSSPAPGHTARKSSEIREASVAASEAAVVVQEKVPATDNPPRKHTYAKTKFARKPPPITASAVESGDKSGSNRQQRAPTAILTASTVLHVLSKTSPSAAAAIFFEKEPSKLFPEALLTDAATATAEKVSEDQGEAATTVTPAPRATVPVEALESRITGTPSATTPLTRGAISKSNAADAATGGSQAGFDRAAGESTQEPGPPRPRATLAHDTATIHMPTAFAGPPNTGDISLRRFLKGQENAVCRHVAVEAQSICKKLKPTQRTYPCTKQVVDKVCEEVPIVIEKMCTKTFYERKPFKCDRVEYKSECIQKKELTKTECVQTVIKGETYPCPKIDYVTKCNKKPALTPSVCKHEVPKEFHYPCERTVKEEQCAEVEKEVDQVCEEDNVVTEKYDCSKTVYVKKCSPAAGRAATAIRATGGETMAPVSERKDETPSQGGGDKAPRRLRKVTVMPESVVVPLPKTHVSVEMCVDVPQVKRKTCTREVVKKERRPCKGVKKEIQCSNVTKVIQEVCSKMKKVVEPYGCTKTEMQQECSTVAKHVEDTCTREVPVDEKGPCEIEIFKNECVPVPVRIPDVCFEARPRTEVYDCSENSTKSVCKEELKEVEKQCVQVDYIEIEYACTQLEHVEKCVVPDKAPQPVAPAQSPSPYFKNHHERLPALPTSETTYEIGEEAEEGEEFQDFEELPDQAFQHLLEPHPMKKDFVTVLTGPPVKRPKLKWREKLHKLGDPDLGEDEKDGERALEKRIKEEEGEGGKK